MVLLHMHVLLFKGWPFCTTGGQQFPLALESRSTHFKHNKHLFQTEILASGIKMSIRILVYWQAKYLKEKSIWLIIARFL